jgi:TIR domain
VSKEGIMPDFFVSYTSSDASWAEWIAWTLEEAGFNVILQKWDFAAGSNFVLEMQKAAKATKRTIAVLSPDFLARSPFGSAEWAAAFARDPDGMSWTLVPVRVRPCVAEGLLKSIVHIDLVGLDEEQARGRLLGELKGMRRKPANPPSYPGRAQPMPLPHPFPGETVRATSTPYMPKIRGAATDIDRRRFIKSTFDLIRQRFGTWLAELAQNSQSLEFDVTDVDATKFTAEIFVNGKSRSECKIWIGGLSGGNDIAYSEGRHQLLGGNSLNEALTIADGAGELALRAMMNFGIGRAAEGLDPEHMSAEDAAQYLWRRFCWTFEE